MAGLLMVNPKKRRKARKATKRKAPKRRAVRRVARKAPVRRRRNPSARKANLKATITSSFIGGAGAVVTDIVASKLPLPAQFKHGAMAPVAKAAVAIGLGFALDKMKQKKLGQQLVEGSLTVIGHSVAKQAIGRFAPQLAGFDEDGMMGYDDDDGGLLAYEMDAYEMGGGFDDEMGAYDGAGVMAGVDDDDDDYDDEFDF